MSSKQEFLNGFPCPFCGHIGEGNECCKCQDPEIIDDAQSTGGMFV